MCAFECNELGMSVVSNCHQCMLSTAAGVLWVSCDGMSTVELLQSLRSLFPMQEREVTLRGRATRLLALDAYFLLDDDDDDREEHGGVSDEEEERRERSSVLSSLF